MRVNRTRGLLAVAQLSLFVALAEEPGKPAKEEAEQSPSTQTAAPGKGPKFLEEGLIPNTIRIPGTDLSLKIGGYVKLDFIQDFDSIGNQFQFKTDTIPVKGTPAAGLDG